MQKHGTGFCGYRWQYPQKTVLNIVTEFGAGIHWVLSTGQPYRHESVALGKQPR